MHLSSNSLRRPKRFTQTMQETLKQVGVPTTSSWVNHHPKKFVNYVAMMSSIIDVNPSSYEATREKAQQDAMIKEYISILKNDV
jgi:hypothetical protein